MKWVLWFTVGLCWLTTACDPGASTTPSLSGEIAAPTNPINKQQEPIDCVPDCTNRLCGDDGCGGTCGSCPQNTTCQPTGQCQDNVCTPDCTDRDCGFDGCGSLCGVCDNNQGCVDGQCAANCTPNCSSRECGDDGCGGSCGMCPVGQACAGNGICAVPCVAQCENKQCGSNGCGGTCGTCGSDEVCSPTGQCEVNPTICTPNCANKSCGNDGCGGVCGTCSEGEECTADGFCIDTGCHEDTDCPNGTWCNADNGECVVLSVEQYWAPTIQVQTDALHPHADFFTTVDYDGDWDPTNNANHLGVNPQPAQVYVSRLETQTHWFLGYYLYFPLRYAAVLPHTYENSFRAVLLVVRKDDQFGQLELMQTASERFFHGYFPENSSLKSATEFETKPVQWSDNGTHPRPRVFVEAGSHNIKNEALETAGSHYTAHWDFVATQHDGLSHERSYALVPLESTLWARRMDTDLLFAQFGQLNRDEASDNAPASLVPWAMHDWLDTQQGWGSILYDPSTLVTQQFSSELDGFSTQYTTNPYATRVDLHALTILADTDQLGAGTSDPYIHLTMFDGYGYERSVLSAVGTNALQFTWQLNNVPVNTTLNLTNVMDRWWFYGLNFPSHDLYRIEIRDADYGADDWLMADQTAWCGVTTGSTTLDFDWSQIQLTVLSPDEPLTNP